MRELTAFPCGGDTLIGTLDDAPGTSGLLIVSGGNEIRSGAHRGMPSLNTVRSPDRISAVVPPRIPSSCVTVTCSVSVWLPSLSKLAFSTVIGTISSANAPFCKPSKARC